MPSIDDLPPPQLDTPIAKGSIDDLPPPKLDAPGPMAVLKGLKDGGLSGAWDVMKANKAAYDSQEHPVVAGSPPLAIPAGALGLIGKAAVSLAEGNGLGYAAGRTALSAAQGAGMSAMDGKEGESWQDKIDRAKSGATLSGGIQAAAEAVPYVGKPLGYLAKKVGEAATGVAPELIENFAKRTDQVNQLIRDSGGNITAMADQVRAELSKGIQDAKQALNGKISAALESAPQEANIPAQSIIDKLEAAKARLNPNYKSDAISDIDGMIQNIKSQAGESGMLTPKGLYETKQFLNASSSGAYNKGGQIFTRASEAARAAKDAAGDARTAIKQYVPDISEADAQLSKMHAIESRLNKNLLAPGTPEGALMAAGSGTNPRNAANLRTLEDISGVNVSQRAKDLATARDFASPSLLPKDFTGKAAARMALGAGTGAALDDDHSQGALIGAALTSPMALKGVINAANVVRKVGGTAGIPQIAQAVRQNPFLAQTVAQLTAGQVRRANTDNPMNGGVNSPDDGARPMLMQNSADVNRTPARGQAAWVQSGAQALSAHTQGKLSQDDMQALMQSPKGKQLLIQASDLKPGSKAMQKVYEQIQQLKGAK